MVLIWRFTINAIPPSFSEGKIIVTIGEVVVFILLQSWSSGFADFNILGYYKKKIMIP